MRLLIIGHAEHGKDTLSEEISKRMSISYASSSTVACDEFLLDRLAEIGYEYSTSEQAWDDRKNPGVRKIWFDEIEAYNRPDAAKLARLLLSKHGIYNGMRSRIEFKACQKAKLFDLVIWIEAFKRKPAESPDSMQLNRHDADIMIDNNGTEQDLADRVARLCLVMDPLSGKARIKRELGPAAVKPRMAPIAQIPKRVPLGLDMCPGCGDPHPPAGGQRCEECGYSTQGDHHA